MGMENYAKDKRLVVAAVSVNSAVERAVLRGVAVAASRFGWTLETIDPSLPGIDFALFAQLLSQADCVVVRLRASWEKVRPLLRPDTPVVGIDILPQHGSGLWAMVNPENVKIGAMAADELLAAHLRCYAFVPALPKMPWDDARGRGFLERVRAAGGDARRYEPRSVWTCAAERDELARWLSQLPRPFGLFARNDLLAKFALGACKSAGIDVPGEASIIGADDDESICLYSTPTRSSVRIDHEGGGRRAADTDGRHGTVAAYGRRGAGHAGDCRRRSRRHMRLFSERTGCIRVFCARIERGGDTHALPGSGRHGGEVTERVLPAQKAKENLHR